MRHIGILKNTIQNYSWGSETAIAELLGDTPRPGVPQAELWMGAHPKAPSQVKIGKHWKSLETLIAENPIDILGARVADKFGGRLPFLFKVLAAAEPLSLQAHPNLTQAREGFARESRLGIPLDAANRNYKDDNHKPECICAMTPFWALSGFRPIEQTLLLLNQLELHTLRAAIEKLRANPDSSGLRAFFYALMTMSDEDRIATTKKAAAKAANLADTDPAFEWTAALARSYPDDIGILSSMYLNLVELQPGQALMLPAGQLHAYLDGVGIELMANSDNVLRGGLTPKHVDAAQLLDVLDFTPRIIRRLSPEPDSSGERVYTSDFEEFVLSTLQLAKGRHYISPAPRSVEVLLCTAGSSVITETDGETALPLEKGTSVLIPAALSRYEITGEATIFKAAVPL